VVQTAGEFEAQGTRHGEIVMAQLLYCKT